MPVIHFQRFIYDRGSFTIRTMKRARWEIILRDLVILYSPYEVVQYSLSKGNPTHELLSPRNAHPQCLCRERERESL